MASVIIRLPGRQSGDWIWTGSGFTKGSLVENLELNAVAGGVTFLEADLVTQTAEAPATYDLVLANLTGSLLQREAGAITALGASAGHLIVSGFQLHEFDDVSAAFTSAGWRLDERTESESWVALRLAREHDTSSP